MNKEVYNKNIESIRNKYEKWAEFIENKKYELNSSIYVDTDQSIDHQTIFRVSTNGKILYLNGKYCPAYAGIDWLNDIGKIEEFATVVIIGIHDTLHIRNILKKVEKTTNILIYEPSIEVFFTYNVFTPSFLMSLKFPGSPVPSVWKVTAAALSEYVDLSVRV